jgi:O-antigen/teichoic acid export membrane protein
MRSLTPRARGTRESLIILIGTNFAMGAIGLITSRLALQLLGPSGRGELAAIQNVSLLLAVVGGAGMADAALYFTAQRPGDIAPIVDRALRVALISSALVTVVAVSIIPLLLDGDSVRDAQMFAPIIIAIALLAVLHQPLRAIGQLEVWSIFRAGPAIAWVSILVVAWLSDYDDPFGLAIAFLLAHVVLVFAGMLLRMLYPHVEGRDGADSPPGRVMLRYGLPSGLVGVPQVLNLRVDQVVMGWAVARSDLGLYATAVAWSTIVAPVFIGLGQLLVPRLASIIHIDEQRRVVRRALIVTLSAAIAMAVVGVPLTHVALPLLLGDSVRPVVDVGQLLLVAGCISGVQLVLGEIHRGLGRPRVSLIAECIGLCATAVCLAVLLPRYGLTGAAVSSIISYSIVVLALLIPLRRLRGSRQRVLHETGSAVR